MRVSGFTSIDVVVLTSMDAFVEPSPHLLLGSGKKTFILDGSGICKMFGEVSLVTLSEHLNFFSSAQPKKLYLSTPSNKPLVIMSQPLNGTLAF